MNRKNDHLFAEFNDESRGPGASDRRDSLKIRPARMEDVAVLGLISADREGGDPPTHAAGFGRAIASVDFGRTSLILVAEVGTEIVAFAKTRYRSEQHEADAGPTPAGWYLTGMVVESAHRRLGIGSQLTAVRLLWICRRSSIAYYFANARNQVSIVLHQRFGFTEVARGPKLAGASFTGGEGILFRVDLTELAAHAGGQSHGSPGFRA